MKNILSKFLGLSICMVLGVTALCWGCNPGNQARDKSAFGNPIRAQSLETNINKSYKTAKKIGKAKSVNWGLKHNGNEQPPTPPTDGAELLKKYDGLYIADTQDKKIFLTFDLGYEAGYTSAVLDTLRKHDVKAIFFLCGHYVDTQDELINRIINDGHMIANHTDKHKKLPTLTDDGIKKDIKDLDAMFYNKFADAPKMTFFRPPSGVFDERTLSIAKDMGMRTMMWSLAIVDWGKTAIDSGKSVDKVMSRIHPGAIILFHITNAGMPDTIEKLIPAVLQKGYEFGKPSEL